MVFAALSFAAVAQEKIETALPALLKYERPLFPAVLRAESISKGYAVIAFTLREGRIDDAVVLEASRVEFGDAVIAVMPTWQFKPAKTGSQREVLRFEFQAQSVLGSLSYLEGLKKHFPTWDGPKAIQTVLSSKLSSPPQRTNEAVEIRTSGAGGKASVSFVIDTDGRVRVPAIVGATNPQLGRAAVETVKQWRFTPSIYENAPVLVEDLSTLTFAPQPVER